MDDPSGVVLAPSVTEAILAGRARAGNDAAVLLTTGAVATDWSEQQPNIRKQIRGNSGPVANWQVFGSGKLKRTFSGASAKAAIDQNAPFSDRPEYGGFRQNQSLARRKAVWQLRAI